MLHNNNKINKIGLTDNSVLYLELKIHPIGFEGFLKILYFC